MEPIETLVPGQVFQIAAVVDDFESALERYSLVFGADPWRCYTFSAAIHAACEYRGGPTDFSVRLALNDQSPQLELIQPVQGPSVHADWLREHGPGLHHVGVIVQSLGETVARMTAAGYPVIQSGRGFGADDDGAYAYFDTEDALGLIVEAVEPPSSLRPPDSVWSRR